MIHLYACSDSTRIPVGSVVPQTSNHVWDAAKRIITLDACRGETIAFQIQADREVQFAATDLSDSAAGVSIPLNIQWWREWPIYVDAAHDYVPGRLSREPAWYYDALGHDDAVWPILSPPGAASTRAYWFDIRVPEDARPGEYAAGIMVGSGVMTTVQTITLNLKIHNAVLQPTAFPFVVGFGKGKLERIVGPWPTSIRPFLDMAEAHGISLMLRNFSAPLRTDGSVASWVDHDRILAPYIERAKVWRLPVPVDAWRTVTPGRAAKMWPDVQRHWQEKAWPLDRAFALIYDEPVRFGVTAEQMSTVIQPIRDVAPAIRILMAERWLPEYEPLGLCDWLAPHGRSYVPAVMDDLRARNVIERKWFYQSGREPSLPLETIDTPALNFRVWPWIALRYGVEGCFYWSGNYWADDPWTEADANPTDYGDGEGTLFYPGPCSSIRMKAIRRGMQDRALLEMARERGQTLSVLAMIATAVPVALNPTGEELPREPGHWIKDPTWYDARVTQLRGLI